MVVLLGYIMPVDKDDRATLTAGSLVIQTIAEGVETSEQLNFLGLQACDETQGYYFSPPLTKDDFEAYVRNKMT
jgi:EAL domain-containing protein (putative c-di-GMP-specific phosphodiesterase class I)